MEKMLELKKKYFELMESNEVDKALEIGEKYVDYLLSDAEHPVLDKEDLIIVWDMGYDEGFRDGYDTCWEDNVEK